MTLRVKVVPGSSRNEITGELANRRQRSARLQISALDEAAQLIDDLLEGGDVEVRIDRKKRRLHREAA